jgi:HAE1 family hydrophobic/amphiphilic exporter-1
MVRYRRGLSWALNHKSHVVCLLVVLIVLTILIPMKRVPQKGEPTGDTRRMMLDVQVYGAQEQGRVDEVLREVERVVLANKEELDIENIFVQSGYMAERNRVNIFLREDEAVRVTTEEAKARLMDLLPVIPDVEFSLPEHKSPGSGAQNQVKILITGNDPATLERIGDEAVRRLSRLEGVVEATTDIEPGHDEIHIAVDRSLAKKYKVSPLIAAQTVAFGLRGFPMKKMKTRDREMDVLVQLEKEDREDVSKLKDLQLLTEDGNLIPLYVAARFREAPGQRVIRREDGKRTVNVRVQTSGEALSIQKAHMEKALASMHLPPGYHMDFGKSITDLKKTQKSFANAILFSILLIYFLLGGLFESYVHPFTILVSVPLALIGSYWVMYLTGSSMDVAAYIGLILMVGIVVNNAIVIVDRMNQLRRSGKEREEAVLQAGVDRLRPVLMTAATTILGLIPLALGGAGLGGMVMFAPLGKAVVGGLAISTLLTLFVVPVFYVYVEQAGEAVRRLYSLARGRRPGTVVP